MTHTRFIFVMICSLSTLALMAFGKIPDSAIGNAFLFLGAIGTGFLSTKFIQHSQWSKKPDV